MTRRYSIEMIDRLLAGDAYDDLVTLSQIMCSSSHFDANASDLGLPPVALAFVESLAWTAQSQRSGVWTYYEATPHERQVAVASALRAIGASWTDSYTRGMIDWADESKIAPLDVWIGVHEADVTRWLKACLQQSRDIVLELTA